MFGLQFFGQRPAFFGQPFVDLCFGIEIRASRGAIVRENDPDRNSRTCLAARSARREDSRRDLGRDRAKEAAKMNVERAPCSDSYAVKSSQVGLGLLGGGCAKVFKERLAVPRVTGPDWPSFYAGSSPADCHRLDQLVPLDQRPAQRHRCARRSGPSYKRSLAGKPRSRRPTMQHDFLIA
jgi:hypothetical protein